MCNVIIMYILPVEDDRAYLLDYMIREEIYFGKNPKQESVWIARNFWRIPNFVTAVYQNNSLWTSADNNIPEILLEILRRAPWWTSRRSSWRCSRWCPRRRPRWSPREWPLGRGSCSIFVMLIVVAVEVVVVVGDVIAVASVPVLVRRDGRWPAMLCCGWDSEWVGSYLKQLINPQNLLHLQVGFH